MREAAARGRGGRLPAGAVPLAVLLPDARTHALFDLAEPIPGPTHRGARRAAAKQAGVVVVVPLFERRAAGRLPQHRGRPRRRRRGRGPLPQDAHPGRPALLREVLLHARRPRLPGLRHRSRADRHAGLLGPVVPGGGAADGAARARRSSSTRRRSAGTRTRRPSTARRSATPGRRSSARTRSPTASTSRRSTASATRGAEGGGGLEFWGASFVADPFGVVLAEASTDTRGDPGRRVRPRAHRGGAPQLAVPARPPHRRLRADRRSASSTR